MELPAGIVTVLTADPSGESAKTPVRELDDRLSVVAEVEVIGTAVPEEVSCIWTVIGPSVAAVLPAPETAALVKTICW